MQLLLYGQRPGAIATTGLATRQTHPPPQPPAGHGYLHTALDDHFRLACTEILSDEIT